MSIESLITVVSVRGIKPKDAPANLFYIGRRCAGWAQSSLANLLKLADESQRSKAMIAYGMWLWENINSNDPIICAEIERIANMVCDGQAVMLGCWCKRPGLCNLLIDDGSDKACHGDVVKQAVLWWIANKSEVTA